MQHSQNSRKNQVHFTTILHLGSICETLGHRWLDWKGAGVREMIHVHCLPQESIIHFLITDVMELQGAIGEVMDLCMMSTCQVCIEYWTLISVSL